MFAKFSFNKLRKPDVLENGVLLVSDPAFRERAALMENGDYFVAEAYRQDDQVLTVIHEHIAAGHVPKDGQRRVVGLDALSTLYEARDLDVDAAETSEIEKKVYASLADAAESRASDLKLIVRHNETEIRAKIAGSEITFGPSWTQKEGSSAAALIFDARDGGSGQVNRTQGKFQSFSIAGSKEFKLPSGVVKLRGQAGFHETTSGQDEHIVLRLFYSDADASTRTLDDLGFDEETNQALARVRRAGDGVMIVGGSTGDGKSTTLIRMVERMHGETEGRLSIVTVEDPVEIRLNGAGILQIPVASAGDGEDRTEVYRQALMHFSRINPDVGVISEIRDRSGAAQVLQFVNSGHLCLTTLHVGEVNNIPFRLVSMGIDPLELARPGVLKLLMMQKLVPVLCPNCAAEVQPHAKLPGYLSGIRSESRTALRFRSPKGCDACRSKTGSLGNEAWVGYSRMRAVAEFIEPDETYLSAVAGNDALTARRHWLKPKTEGGLGGATLGQKVLDAVLRGEVDPFDAENKRASEGKVETG